MRLIEFTRLQVFPDIEKVSVKVKHMELITLAEGTAFYIQSKRCMGTHHHKSKFR